MFFAIVALPIIGGVAKAIASYRVSKTVQKDLETKSTLSVGCTGQILTVDEYKEMQVTQSADRLREIFTNGETRWEILQGHAKKGDPAFSKEKLAHVGIGVCDHCWNIVRPDVPGVQQ